MHSLDLEQEGSMDGEFQVKLQINNSKQCGFENSKIYKQPKQ